jgi:hypothetical protein
VCEHPDPRPRDHKDAAQDLARDLADIAAQLASPKGEAYAWMRDPNYDTLKLRLEAAHSAVEAAAVEARRRVRLNESRNTREKAGAPTQRAHGCKEPDPGDRRILVMQSSDRPRSH